MKLSQTFNLPKHFKAAVLVAQNSPLKILDLKFPENLEQGQVLVKIRKAGICGAQIGEIDGVKGPDKWIPHCFGHEGFGTVIAHADDVTTVRQNDEVIMHWRKGDGLNSTAPKYESNIGTINAGFVTTFQEYAVVSENRITKVDDTNKIERIIPLLGCVLPTSYGMLTRESKLENDHSILVIGSGGVGMSIAVSCKNLGANNVTLVDQSSFKKQFADYFKFRFVESSTAIEMENQLNGIRFNKVIDTTGVNELISSGFNLLDADGELIIVGQPRVGTELKLFDPIRMCKLNRPYDGVKIFASDGGGFKPDEDMRPLIDHTRENIANYDKLVTHELTLDEINSGINLVRSGEAVRVIINL